VYAEVVRHLVPGERVRILVDDAATEKRARGVLTRAGVDLGRVDFFRVATDRSWTRDFCPLFVRRDDSGDVALTNWRFTGWAKYPNHKRDDAVPDRLAKKLGRRQWLPAIGGRRLVLEGGAIDVNGRGTLLATEECLQDRVQERNPGVPRADLERALADHLGARHVLWLGRGIVGDDTHGHVDDIARFVDRDTVVLAFEEDPADANHARSRDNERRLAHVRGLRVVKLPYPRAVTMDGVRLPASYANFYVANGALLVPTFNDANDRVALNTLAACFPGRAVVGIHAVDLVWGLGTLHCLTQQEPAART
jgi:agmatine deiminase